MASADDNVHVQNTYEMVSALVQSNKQFDLFIYPDRNHGIYGGNTRLHLYQMMTDYIFKRIYKPINYYLRPFLNLIQQTNMKEEQLLFGHPKGLFYLFFAEL